MKLVSELRDSLTPDGAVRLIYLLKAWKVLSDDKKIDNEDLSFDSFYHSKITLSRLKNRLERLAKEHHIFSLPSPLETSRNRITDETLVVLLNEIQENANYPKIPEIFYSSFGGMRDYYVSSQVVELGVKLLGNGCNEIYSPFSRQQSIPYYTDAKVYAEALADEFVIELMKIIDNKDITFYFTDPLEKPSYVNPDAPHLLKQFECTLSFPPMGMRGRPYYKDKDCFNRFKIYQGRGNRDMPHFEHILAQTKNRAIVLMPVGFSYRAGVEMAFREYLIENNLLDAVIQFPPNLHVGTSIETTFFIVDKNKTDNSIQFINLNQDRFLQKEKRRIVLKNLDEIVNIYLQRKEVENVSAIVPNHVIAENRFSLSVDRYVLSKEASQLKNILARYAVVSLQEIADIRRSQMFRDEEEGVEVLEISPSDIANAGHTTDTGKHKKIGSQERRLETYRLQPNDILLSTKGTIGKVGIVGKSDKPMIASQAMQVIRLHEEAPVDPIVLYMYLKSNIAQALLKQLVSGTAMPQISTREIKEFKVPVLPVDEQKRIIENFHEEVKLYNEIEKKKKMIHQIHSQFLGEKE